MDFKVIIDWKLVVALGGFAVGVIFALKLDPSEAKEVSIHVVDAFRENALHKFENC